MPDAIKVILLLVVGTLLAFGCIGLPAYFIAQQVPSERVRGIRFYFLPRRWGFFRPAWSRGFQAAYVERFVDAYARSMPAAYLAAGASVTTDELLAHFAQVKCIFQLGYLRSLPREQANMTDVDNDGDVDRFTGLTVNPFLIQVGVVEERRMLLAGAMRIEKTAFTYELHNTAVERFCGKGVALAESFVADDDKRLEPYLQGGALLDLKQRRRTLDAAYDTINTD